jgi:hypothetical protein
MTILRKDIRAVRVGDRFKLGDREREVVSVRPCQFDEPGMALPLPGREILHKCPHRPGVDYLRVPEGSQLAVLIP